MTFQKNDDTFIVSHIFYTIISILGLLLSNVECESKWLLKLFLKIILQRCW